LRARQKRHQSIKPCVLCSVWNRVVTRVHPFKPWLSANFVHDTYILYILAIFVDSIVVPGFHNMKCTFSCSHSLTFDWLSSRFELDNGKISLFICGIPSMCLYFECEGTSHECEGTSHDGGAPTQRGLRPTGRWPASRLSAVRVTKPYLPESLIIWFKLTAPSVARRLEARACFGFSKYWHIDVMSLMNIATHPLITREGILCASGSNLQLRGSNKAMGK